MKKIKIGICGHFGADTNPLNGQTIKTKSLTKQLNQFLGEDEVLIEDTYGGIKVLPKTLFGLFKFLLRCENVIILPAHNSVKIFPIYLILFNMCFKRKLHYVVIGGWLPQFLEKRKLLTACLKKFDGIYVETSSMLIKLKKLGFNNIYIMPNFKELNMLQEENLQKTYIKPYKICTFSRVMKEKGIEDAIEIVKKINSEAGKVIFELDIYGEIDSNYQEKFIEIESVFPSYIKYKGCVQYNKSVDVLKDYFILLFPTLFYTEGVPGTIIDAYASGIPIITSRWENYLDVIEENVTAISYEFADKKKLEECLLFVANEPEVIINMKKECLRKVEEFKPKNAMKVLLENLG